MVQPLLAIVGNPSPIGISASPMKDRTKAREAPERLGEKLAHRGARLLLCGGTFREQGSARAASTRGTIQPGFQRVRFEDPRPQT